VVESAKSKKVVGVVSESDIVKFMGRTLHNKSLLGGAACGSLWLALVDLAWLGKKHFEVKKNIERISKIKIKHAMSGRVVSVTPEESVFDAAMKMDKHDVNRLPVVSEGRLVGIIARADLVKALIE
jgi:CBS domain-containing protein